MGRSVLTILLLLSFVGFVPGFPASAWADQNALPEEKDKCLGCHGDRGVVKKFQNSESIAAYVNPQRFSESAHGNLACHSCHKGFGGGGHPNRTFRSKRQYRIWSSEICRRCHGLKQLRKKAVHEAVLDGYRDGVTPVCTDCHDAHSTFAASGGKALGSERDFCLNCHADRPEMIFRDGVKFDAAVDAAPLEASVHRELSCSDCHFGFSSKSHPRRNFKTRRDFAIASSQTCRRCHFDKYTKTLESIHFTLLSKGNLSAPVCTDCHGSHSVREGRVEKILSGKRCKRCHRDIYDIYAQSVHGKALIDEHNQDVPICVDCHKAHDIRDPRTVEYRERIPGMCGDCHANGNIVGKYGLSTGVVKSYLSDFHGVTLGFYRMQRGEGFEPGKPIAVCTDCHGTHNIGRVVGRDEAVIKSNLVRRCRKCHGDMDENFPSAWLYHYAAGTERSSLVFWVNGVYEIFMPIMVMGLLLQILLHIWRYAINR